MTLRTIARVAAEAAVALAVVLIVLAGWRRDFHVPIYFTYDALEYLMQAKGTLENGWWWVHPRLAAPGVFEQVAFPSNPNVDQAIVWTVGRFTSDVGLAVNASWIVMLVASALLARGCFTLLGVSGFVAAGAGLLFALSPYALYRNIDHFALATYLVPAPATAALLIAAGRFDTLRKTSRRWLGAGCALAGFNYIYYPFFACFLLLTAAIVAAGRERRARALTGGVLLAGIICAATAVNMAPSYRAWMRAGKPSVMLGKTAAEADQYGLKIRHLVGPVFAHAFPPFRAWVEREDSAGFPLEGENRTSRLGLVATAGFLLLLASFFVPSVATVAAGEAVFVAAGRLTLAALLLATVGGFGSLFNLFVSPAIRAYTRITPFILFFSLAALALVVDRWLASARAGRSRSWAPAVAAGLLAIGLLDESQAAAGMNREHGEVAQDWRALQVFVAALESRLPDGAMVFQLPVMVFSSDAGRERMRPLDHIRPYLRSSKAHFAYPALTDSLVRWQQQVGRLPPPVMTAALAAARFDAILIDRHGYRDGGTALARDLSTTPAAVLAEDDRYIALDVRRLPAAAVDASRLPRPDSVAAPATAGLPPCGVATAHTIEWIGTASQPFDVRPVAVSSGVDLTIAGWAVDEPHRVLAADVDVVLDGRLFPAFYGIDRRDVARFLDIPDLGPAGFSATLPGIAAGPHELAISVLARDRSCAYTTARIPIVAR